MWMILFSQSDGAQEIPMKSLKSLLKILRASIPRGERTQVHTEKKSLFLSWYQCNSSAVNTVDFCPLICQ